jgi:hypothetical protein
MNSNPLKTLERQSEMAIPAGLEPATRGVETIDLAPRCALNINTLTSFRLVVRGTFR